MNDETSTVESVVEQLMNKKKHNKNTYKCTCCKKHKLKKKFYRYRLDKCKKCILKYVLKYQKKHALKICIRNKLKYFRKKLKEKYKIDFYSICLKNKNIKQLTSLYDQYKAIYKYYQVLENYERSRNY